MVRFKNRYIIGQLPLHLSSINITDGQLPSNSQQKSLLSHIKSLAQQYHGQLFLSKITFSLQIKYFSNGYTVIRVPRDHCQLLIGALFFSKLIKVKRTSGTIKGVQKWLNRELRILLGRELEDMEKKNIGNIDYS